MEVTLPLPPLLIGASFLLLAYWWVNKRTPTKWSWKGKVVAITGASSGIGKAIALQLSAAGSKVVLAARRLDVLQKVQQECEALGGEAVCVQCDVSSKEDCLRFIDTAIAHYGCLDCLFVNAGITMNADFADLEDFSMMDTIMGVNFNGAVYCTKFALPHLLKRPESRIAVTSSTSGCVGVPKRTFYAASKHAVNGFFDSLRLEIAPQGCLVTLVCPNYLSTDLDRTRLGSSAPLPKNSNSLSVSDAVRASLFEVAAGSPLYFTHTKSRLIPFLKAHFPALLDRFILSTTKKRNSQS